MPLNSPKKIRYLGLNLTIDGWAKRLGVSRQRLDIRLKTYPMHIALDPDPEARRAAGRAASEAVYLMGNEEYTVAQIMCREGVSRRTVYNWAEAGKIRRVSGSRNGRYGKV